VFAEGSLSPTRRYLALENKKDKLFFSVLDLGNDGKWTITFVHAAGGIPSGFNSIPTVFHQNNRLAVVWQALNKVTCLKADDRSPAFDVVNYATPGYGAYFWDGESGEARGLRYGEKGLQIHTLDGKVQTAVPIDLLIPGPYLMLRQGSFYRLWVTKSETKLPSVNSAAGLSGCAIHCLLLKKSATGYEVVEDKFVAKVRYPNERGGLRGYLAVEDKGSTYKLSMKTFPLGSSNADMAIGEFAY
jgi:hypothetical protein